MCSMAFFKGKKSSSKSFLSRKVFFFLPLLFLFLGALFVLTNNLYLRGNSDLVSWYENIGFSEINYDIFEIQKNDNSKIRFNAEIENPRQWSAEHPNLYTLILELKNNKQYIGTLNAFDIHINVVLEEAEEREAGEVKRKLGVVFIRGDTITIISPA